MANEKKRVSLSRLSALAKPFTLTKPNNPSLTLLNSSLHNWHDTSFSRSSPIPDQSFSKGDSFCYYPQYPSGDFQVPVDLGFVSESTDLEFDANKSTKLGYITHKETKVDDRQGFLHWKDEIGTFSMSCDTSTKHAVNSRATPSKLSISPNLCPTATLQDLQSGLTFPPSAVSWSACDAIFHSNYRRSFSQQLDSNAAKPSDSRLTDGNSLPAPVSEVSVASTSYSSFNPASLENVDSYGHDAVSNNNIFSYGPASAKQPHVSVEKSQEVFDDKILTDKSKEGKTGNPVINEVMDPAPNKNSEFQITCPRVPYDLTLKSNDVNQGDPIENSSKMFDENDSDLDSPCWKGTLAANQSTCEVSGPKNLQDLKTRQKARGSLNPLAPQFFPSNDRRSVSGNECDNDGCLSVEETAPSTVYLLSREQRLQSSATARSSTSEQGVITDTDGYGDMPVPNKEHGPLSNPTSSSMLNSTHVAKPTVLDDCFTATCQPLTGPNVGGPVKAIKDPVPNGSTSMSLFAEEHVTSSPSSRIGIHDLTETCGAATKYLCSPPGLEIQIVVSMMNKLSEMLMQNCTNDLESLNEHDHDIIKRIINNLTGCIRNRVGKSTSESSHPCTSYGLRKSADINKCSNMELQSEKTKAVTVPHKLGYQDKHGQQEICSSSFSQGFPGSLCARKNEETEKSEYITQIIARALKGHNQLEEKLNPQALFYKNLWLEAEAALCSLKYKACVLGMKTEMERCQFENTYDSCLSSC